MNKQKFYIVVGILIIVLTVAIFLWYKLRDRVVLADNESNTINQLNQQLKTESGLVSSLNVYNNNYAKAVVNQHYPNNNLPLADPNNTSYISDGKGGFVVVAD